MRTPINGYSHKAVCGCVSKPVINFMEEGIIIMHFNNDIYQEIIDEICQRGFNRYDPFKGMVHKYHLNVLFYSRLVVLEFYDVVHIYCLWVKK